jgi:hypothetical protein
MGIIPSGAITLIRDQAPKIKAVTGKKVLVLPFTNKTSSLKAVYNVWQQVINRFDRAGYKAAPIDEIRPVLISKNYRPSMALTFSEVKELAGLFKAHLIVTGSIDEFKSEKRFRISALPWGGSVLYSSVNLDCSVYDASTMREIYKKKTGHTKKRQFMGAFQAHGDNLDYCLKDVVNKIFNPF